MPNSFFDKQGSMYSSIRSNYINHTILQKKEFALQVVNL